MLFIGVHRCNRWYSLNICLNNKKLRDSVSLWQNTCVGAKMSEIQTKTKQELCESLGKFLSIYHKTKIIEAKEDTLKMYILLSKNKNVTPKEKLINYKLLRVNERMFESAESELSPKDAVICEFLIEELLKYVANYHKHGK